ncbi:MAG: hypothetical protein NXI13_02440 [Proteobacteria bacterium]|nr:hypothetical protein [Pseudomonadota bacterium]
MAYGAVKLNLMVIGIVSVLLAGGVTLLGLTHEGNAAPVACSGEYADKADCSALESKAAVRTDAVLYGSVLQKSYDHGILYTGETAAPAETKTKTSMVPLPPALVLFGGAMLGMIYLGRRRKVKPVQDE